MADIACHLDGMTDPASRPDLPPSDRTAPEPPGAENKPPAKAPKEIGGPPGPEPTRYGDWQYNGRVTDF